MSIGPASRERIRFIRATGEGVKSENEDSRNTGGVLRYIRSNKGLKLRRAASGKNGRGHMNPRLQGSGQKGFTARVQKRHSRLRTTPTDWSGRIGVHW